ncbi:MAG TPA: gamma-glutamyltransferase [Phycisphaerales bacterium]|nr:gamma-glutamyltransferase [Phycisphaerales bacterium]
MPTQVFPSACVAADHRLASEAGAEVLRAGGNAVDAAVAASFALSVVRPYSCGVGGGGFMVVRLREHPRLVAKGAAPLTRCINYRETAPAATRADSYEDVDDPHAATHGGRAVGVPGTVAGLLHALEKYGTLPRDRVLAPAIRLAHEGFDVDAHYMESVAEVIGWVRGGSERAPKFPLVWERYLKRGGVALGDRVRVPEQARVFERIAAEGRAGFYGGEVARAMVDAVHETSGELSLEDLASYGVVEGNPFVAAFRGKRILCQPPPSSGGIVLAQVFAMLEARREDLERIVREDGHNSARYVHLVCEACKHAFADRARWLGDTRFVDVPLGTLLDPARLRDAAAKIDLTRTREQDWYGVAPPPKDDSGTSHLCAVDRWGNAVACTETINLIFGSLVGVDEFGFILNDTMDDFVTRAGKANAFGLSHGRFNRPAAGKRPLSSMTPTIVLASDDADAPPFMIAGGAGGPRIISGTMQSILNVLLFDMDAQRAIDEPRFHHQWSPHTLQLEAELLESPLRGELAALGHEVTKRQPIANVQVIRRDPGGGWQGACDPRKGGAPAGD